MPEARKQDRGAVSLDSSKAAPRTSWKRRGTTSRAFDPHPRQGVFSSGLLEGPLRFVLSDYVDFPTSLNHSCELLWKGYTAKGMARQTNPPSGRSVRPLNLPPSYDKRRVRLLPVRLPAGATDGALDGRSRHSRIPPDCLGRMNRCQNSHAATAAVAMENITGEDSSQPLKPFAVEPLGDGCADCLK